MAGVVFSLNSLADHVGQQMDYLVEAVKNGDSAEATKLYEKTIYPYLEDLDEFTYTQLENELGRAFYTPSATNLEKARELVDIFTRYLRLNVPGRRYVCPTNLDSPKPKIAAAAAQALPPMAVPLDDNSSSDEASPQSLQVVPKMKIVVTDEPTKPKSDEEVQKELEESLVSIVQDFF